MLVKHTCNSCRAEAPLWPKLLALDLGPQRVVCKECRKAGETDFQTRVHITAYRLLILSCLSGLLLGATIKLEATLRYLFAGEIGLTISSFLGGTIFFGILMTVMVGLPLFYFASVPIQLYLDNVSKAGRHREKRKSADATPRTRTPKQSGKGMPAKPPKDDIFLHVDRLE